MAINKKRLPLLALMKIMKVTKMTVALAAFQFLLRLIREFVRILKKKRRPMRLC